MVINPIVFRTVDITNDGADVGEQTGHRSAGDRVGNDSALISPFSLLIRRWMASA